MARSPKSSNRSRSRKRGRATGVLELVSLAVFVGGLVFVGFQFWSGVESATPLERAAEASRPKCRPVDTGSLAPLGPRAGGAPPAARPPSSPPAPATISRQDSGAASEGDRGAAVGSRTGPPLSPTDDLPPCE